MCRFKHNKNPPKISKIALNFRNQNSLKMMRRFLTTPVRTMAAEAATGMKFTFSCPAAVHYQDATNVSQIDLPTGTGMMGILPQHVPTIGVLAAGWATVYSGANASRYFVSSGSYTITDSGAVMIAAEEALAESEIDMEAAKKQLVAYQAKVSVGSDVEKAEAQIAVEALEAMLK